MIQKSLRYCIVLLFFIFPFQYIVAQHGQNYAVIGRVTNKTNGELLEMVTVRLFADSLFIGGVQTDDHGQFVLKHIKQGKYILCVSAVGYKEKSLNINILDKDLNLKTIALEEDIQALSEVEVRGTAAEMVVRGDTVEYNATAYKTAENAMAEELLKKMPGVEVDKDGNVTVNGESITAVRIDGKKFFGDDVQMATKNIPANMIDKVQVIDEKSDMAKLTGFEDDDTERIINFTLKENKKKGLFGNFAAGLGSDIIFDNGNIFGVYDPLNSYKYTSNPSYTAKQFFSQDFRYEGSVFLNILSGDAQTTIIAGANNDNAMRSGRGLGPMMGNNSGITWTENLGVNTNVSCLGGKVLIGADATLNHSINQAVTNSRKESYTDEYTYTTVKDRNQTSHAWDSRLRMEIEWQIDSLNKLIFQPQISYTQTLKDGREDYTYTKDNDTTTIGWQQNLGTTEEIAGRMRVIYNRKTQKPGRTFTLRGTADFNNSKDNSTNISENQQLGELTLINQQQKKVSNNSTYDLRFSWVEPLYKNQHFLETVLSFNTNLRSSNKTQNIYNQEDNDYTTPDSLYSNAFNSKFFSETLELNYRYKQEKIDLTAGLRINPSQTISETHYLIADTASIRSKYVWNFAPNLNFKYQMGKKEFIRIRYRGRTMQPSVNQMEPVRDNSNAMSETVGNLDLNPAFRHNFHFMYSTFQQDKMLSIMTGLHATFTKDALVMNSIYDETGKLYSQTVNAQAMPYNINGDFMISVPIIKNRLHLNSRTSAGFNQRISYLLKEQKAEDIDLANLLIGNENRTGNTTVREDLSLRLSHDVVDFGVRGKFSYSYTINNMQTVTAPHVFDWGVSADFTFHLPKNWTIATDLGYNDRIGYQLSGSMAEILWNASIQKSWGAHTLTLKCVDMLNQQKNIIQTVSENSISYAQYNTLPTYFMLTYSCKLNRMGDMKAKGRAAFMQEMIEGGGFDPSKGGMPMPPPPMR